MSKVQEVKKAMLALGYPETKYIELEDLDDSRSKGAQNRSLMAACN